jgi:hypothetical protein
MAHSLHNAALIPDSENYEIQLNLAVAPAIILVHQLRYPTAVLWAVAEMTFFPINLKSLSVAIRFRPKVERSSIRKPFLADRDPSRSVVAIAGGFRIVAPCFHAVVHFSKARIRPAMSPTLTIRFGYAEVSEAGLVSVGTGVYMEMSHDVLHALGSGVHRSAANVCVESRHFTRRPNKIKLNSIRTALNFCS